jgi:hypothetical protein
MTTLRMVYNKTILKHNRISIGKWHVPSLGSCRAELHLFAADCCVPQRLPTSLVYWNRNMKSVMDNWPFNIDPVYIWHMTMYARCDILVVYLTYAIVIICNMYLIYPWYIHEFMSDVKHMPCINLAYAHLVHMSGTYLFQTLWFSSVPVMFLYGHGIC